MRTSRIRYEPCPADAVVFPSIDAGGALVIGEPSDVLSTELNNRGLDARWVLSPFAKFVPSGTYALRRGSDWHLVILVDGGPPAAAREDELRHVTDDDSLAQANNLFETLWDRADLVGGGPLLANGSLVRIVGDGRYGRVVAHKRVKDTFRYTVIVDGERQDVFADSLEEVDGDPRDPEFWIRQPPASATQTALTLTWTKLRHPLTDVVYSFQASKTVFRAYQFRPVLKMLAAGHHRLLIADEVGLGKTIEAGLIWSELEQRAQLSRVLVVCPAALVLKWKAEMERRFDRRLDVVRRTDLGQLADALDRGDGDAPFIGVISLESLRSSDELERLAALHPRFDLVVVDEAHYLRNRETRSHAMGRLLSDWADALVFLSATPLNLRSTDLFNLLNLLDEEHFSDANVFPYQLEPNRRLNEVARLLAVDGGAEPRKLLAKLDEVADLEFGTSIAARPDFDQLRALLDVGRPLTHAELATCKRHLAELNTLSGILTRTRKVDVPDAKAVREPQNVDVRWTDQEQAFYAAVWRWFRERAQRQGIPPGFAMQMPLRQAASCIPAMQMLLAEREPGLFAEDVDDIDEDAGGDEEGSSNGDDLVELSAVDVLRRPLDVDTKFEQLLAKLLDARDAGLEQMMIFSFFRRTLGYLHERLRDEFSVEVMHGGTAMADRERIMGDFRAGKFDILLLSEVGSEGLDFEFCNVLVNYDLPWNPMRVEQRIGRLDRFGQRHEKIFIYNMRVPGTIETDIFQRLYDRIHVFESSIGELEPILRDELAGFTRRVLDPTLTADQREEQVKRIAVAIEGKRQMVDEIRESQGLLAGVDQLLIEGFESDSPGRGRFVGPQEIRAVVQALFQRHGGRIEGDPETSSRLHLIGTPELAQQLLYAKVPDTGTRYGRSRLAGMLRESQPIVVTLSSEDASQWDTELLSTRHPLVRLAVDELGEEILDLRRFGRVRIPELPAQSRYLVVVYLATSTGLRPALELWGAAVDVDTGAVAESVGEQLLVALADGSLADSGAPVPERLEELLAAAETWLAERQRAVEAERQRDNAALVDARLRSQQQSIQLKIQRTEEALAKVGVGGDQRVIRMNESHIRNLQQRLIGLEAEMTPKKQLSLRVQPIAVVLVEGGR